MKTSVCGGFLAAILVVAAPFAPLALADDHEHAPQHKHDHRHHTLPPAAAPELSGDSLYQLESLWRNQDGKLQPLRALAGRPVVAAMIYTSCEFACPLIVRDMLAIQNALGDGDGLSRHPRSPLSGGGDGDGDGDGDRDGDGDGDHAAQFVLFSFDPQRDTPAAMRDYAAKKSLPAPHWELLAADDDATLELAVALGVRYQPVAGGDFAHSNIVFVLNCGGEVTHRQEGLGLPPADAVAAVHAAAGDCGG